MPGVADAKTGACATHIQPNGFHCKTKITLYESSDICVVHAVGPSEVARKRKSSRSGATIWGKILLSTRFAQVDFPARQSAQAAQRGARCPMIRARSCRQIRQSLQKRFVADRWLMPSKPASFDRCRSRLAPSVHATKIYFCPGCSRMRRACRIHDRAWHASTAM